MNQITQQKLIALNNDFYTKVAPEFSQTRQSPWSGWERLISFIPHKETAVLDVGCGNGRFGKFLLDKNILIQEYVGMDFNEMLLNEAKANLPKLEFKFEQADLVGGGLGQIKDNYDLVVAFGLTHHIPGQEKRQEFVKQLLNKVDTGGLLIVSFWQFLNDSKIEKKLIANEKVAKQIGIDLSELEPNDYFLGWKDRADAIRYCHFTDGEEINSFKETLNVNVIGDFLVDGKTGNLNRYLVLEKHLGS